MGRLPEAQRVARPDTAHLFFGTWKSLWYKNTWGMGYRLRPRWELAWYCHKGKPPFVSPAPPDVWECNRDHRLRHPCQKPVDLLRRAIRFACPPGGTVADYFAGIASTAVAAITEDRHFIGSELDRRHHKLGQARIKEAKIARDSRAARFSSNAG